MLSRSLLTLFTKSISAMKSYKYRALLATDFILCFYFLWRALNSTNDNVGFFFNLGVAMLFFSGLLEDWKDPARFKRLRMTFPELYQDIKKNRYQPPLVVRSLSFLSYAFIIIAVYLKFFAH